MACFHPFLSRPPIPLFCLSDLATTMSISGDNAGSAVLEQCTTKLTNIIHSEYPRLLKHILVKAVHPSEGEVGSLSALRINRDKFYGGFLEILDEERG